MRPSPSLCPETTPLCCFSKRAIHRTGFCQTTEGDMESGISASETDTESRLSAPRSEAASDVEVDPESQSTLCQHLQSDRQRAPRQGSLRWTQ